MTLRKKLLLGVALLLLFLLFILFILPAYFIPKDVRAASGKIRNLLIEEHRQLAQSQQNWLLEAVSNIKENNDGLLLMLYETPQISAHLTFASKKEEPLLWMALARIAGYDPKIGYIQIHDPNQNKSASIFPYATSLYPVEQTDKKEASTLFTLNAQDQKESYRGFLLSHGQEAKMTLYLLIDSKSTEEQEKLLKEELLTLFSTINEAPYSLVESQEKKAFEWATKINLMRALAPFYALNPELRQMVAGIAQVDALGKGEAILAKEAYSTEPLFDDLSYYQKHPPHPGAPPIATGSAIFTQELGNHSYIGNTLFLNGSYCTLGTALSFLPHQLALSTNGNVVLEVNKKNWIGFGGAGISQETLQAAARSGAFEKQQGDVKLAGESYFFDQVVSLEEGNIVLYDLHPNSGVKTIFSTLLSMEDKLVRRIFFQLIFIALGTVILVLFFIGRLGLTIIHPITQLARATQEVVAGHYGEVRLPSVGKRKDEVAILIRSFEEMVVGLQEREKIRGILDKVVSKDVAEEILRTQIHLGGEDRVVTMLFCDIRGFSTLTATLPPQQTIELLNACMTKVSRVIEGEGGVIDKYVGDEVMAIFGAPTAHPDHALRAVSTGMLIAETLKKWNHERVEAGEQILFEMGIGIHTGLVVAGNMGAEDRLNYTVLGANVNLAARLCQVAKPNQLIISAVTLAEPNVKESFYTHPLTSIFLKGFAQPVQVFEITGFKWNE